MRWRRGVPGVHGGSGGSKQREKRWRMREEANTWDPHEGKIDNSHHPPIHAGDLIILLHG